MRGQFGFPPQEVAPQMADEEVVRRVLEGETSLFELLIRRYNQRLYRVTKAILKDDQESEDAMQEAYVCAFTNLDRFAGEAKVSTWLTRIAVYEALGRLRRRKRMDVMPELVSGGANPETSAYVMELHAAIETAVETLPPLYRSVFVLRDIEELSVAETAESLGITEETVKTRLHRGRKLLRRRLERALGAAMNGAFAFAGQRCDRITARTMERILDHSRSAFMRHSRHAEETPVGRSRNGEDRHG
jgi:RNA polymerase sigma-70 factor (ECF subfamily)